MKPLTVEEERQQELVIVKGRQASLLWLGICLLLLWMVPHPHGGIYQVLEGNRIVTGTFPGLTQLRTGITLVAWLSVLTYLLKPVYVRWRWRKWYPFGL